MQSPFELLAYPPLLEFTSRARSIIFGNCSLPLSHSHPYSLSVSLSLSLVDYSRRLYLQLALPFRTAAVKTLVAL